jgi:hypothetical protein
MVPSQTTHQVDIQVSCGVVVKSFRSPDRREAEREWAALTLLAGAQAQCRLRLGTDMLEIF